MSDKEKCRFEKRSDNEITVADEKTAEKANKAVKDIGYDA